MLLAAEGTVVGEHKPRAAAPVAVSTTRGPPKQSCALDAVWEKGLRGFGRVPGGRPEAGGGLRPGALTFDLSGAGPFVEAFHVSALTDV